MSSIKKGFFKRRFFSFRLKYWGRIFWKLVVEITEKAPLFYIERSLSVSSTNPGLVYLKNYNYGAYNGKGAEGLTAEIIARSTKTSEAYHTAVKAALDGFTAMKGE